MENQGVPEKKLLTNHRLWTYNNSEFERNKTNKTNM